MRTPQEPERGQCIIERTAGVAARGCEGAWSYTTVLFWESDSPDQRYSCATRQRHGRAWINCLSRVWGSLTRFLIPYLIVKQASRRLLHSCAAIRPQPCPSPSRHGAHQQLSQDCQRCRRVVSTHWDRSSHCHIQLGCAYHHNCHITAAS